MTELHTPAVFPGPVQQVGHMVADIDGALDEWLALGVGPWTVFEVTQPGAVFRGRSASPTTVIGLANVGPFQIELIEARGESTSVWHEARDLGRFGPHHIAYWADDFDAALASAESAGLEVVQSGDGNGMARFVYFASPTGQLIELMELTDICRAFMDDVRRSAETWDGTGPAVRR